MTDMSPGALPPRQPPITEADRKHPLFPQYQQHRSAMAARLVEAPAFADWLYQRERNAENDAAAAHQLHAEFQAWMRANQGGARPCPVGAYPFNFYYWLEGGRW